MSSGSIAESRALTQDPDHTKQLIESHFIKPLAEALYRYRTRRDDAQLSELTLTEQMQLFEDATVLGRLRDQAAATAAMYCAADFVTARGIGSMPLVGRMSLIAAFDFAFDHFRKALAGRLPRQVERFTKLAEADTEAARDAKDRATRVPTLEQLRTKGVQ